MTPEEWQIGDVILDLYEVTALLGQGGMGKVHKVHHRGWDVDLAVKSPGGEVFGSSEARDDFVREAATWVNLGLYPHIVSCYYVRTLGGIPRVFAEYVEGGSLADWIHSRRLYEGGATRALERILDIAVQFAWGLDYAHEQGVVHQDVKPANVMMTADGTAKVSDFGLARARASGRPAASPDLGRGHSVLVPGCGLMTPAYCSPEQARGERLSRKTDIWSWGVSVLEMFTGEVTWVAGQAAPEALEGYLDAGLEDDDAPSIPTALASLVRRCFARLPEHRPKTMAEVATALQEVYASVTGAAHLRPAPEATELRADGLNNRALSYLDLGKAMEAEEAMRAALDAHPEHPEATYNRGLILWRRGEMTDEALVRQLGTVRSSHVDPRRPGYLLALLHLERGDVDSAIPLMEEAAQAGQGGPELRATLLRIRSGDLPAGRAVATLEGHAKTWWGGTIEGGVTAVCLSANGRLALSGGGDRTVRLWDVASGRCLRVLEGHPARPPFDPAITCVQLTPDGRWALSAAGDPTHYQQSGDGTILLWDVATGTRVRALEHGGTVTSMRTSADGRFVLSASWDDLRLWEMESGRRVWSCSPRTTGAPVAYAVCLSADGRWALVAGRAKHLTLIEVATGDAVRRIEGHTVRGVHSVDMDAVGRLGLSGGEDRTVRLWDLATGRCLRTLEGHRGTVWSVSLSADGRWALSSGSDRTVRLWEVATGRCLRTFEGHQHDVLSVAVSADGRTAASGSLDNTLRIWSLPERGSSTAAPFQITRPWSHAALLEAESRGRWLLRETTASLARGDSPRALRHLREARALPGYESTPAVRQLWARLSQRCRRTGLRAAWQSGALDAERVDLHWLCLSEDAHLAISGETIRLKGERDRFEARLWDVASRACLVSSADLLEREAPRAEALRRWRGPRPGEAGRSSWDGSWELLGGRAGTWHLCEVATGRRVRTFETWQCRFGADETWILTIGPELKLWELATGRCLRTLEGHKDGVSCACPSADGRWILSGSQDTTLRLWEGATGRCAQVFAGHLQTVTSACLTADGLWALSGSNDGTLRVWELATGRCLAVLTGHEKLVTCACLSTDGLIALSGGADRTLRIWGLEWELETHEPADWDEGVRPYLDVFLSVHQPWAGVLPADREPTRQEVTLALTRRGRPTWNNEDFEGLLHTLGSAGYGWLRPEGVCAALDRLASAWQGPPQPQSVAPQ